MSTFEDRERAEFETAMMALEGQGFERGDFDTKTNGDYSCLIIQGASLGWLAHAKQAEYRLAEKVESAYREGHSDGVSAGHPLSICNVDRDWLGSYAKDDLIAASQENSKSYEPIGS